MSDFSSESDDTINTAFASASAPGKVILFGEHAVVHGVSAIAAALSDLRIEVGLSALADVNGTKLVLLDMLDSEGNPQEVFTSWDSIEATCTVPAGSDIPPSTPPSPEMVSKMMSTIGTGVSTQVCQSTAAFNFLALRMLRGNGVLEQAGMVGVSARVKSRGLPLGAGLGSSGAFSVAMAAACMCLEGQLSPPTSAIHLDVKTVFEDPAQPPPPPHRLEQINEWAFASEVIIHGEPSGLDNTTSCYGGAIKMCKANDPPFVCLPRESTPDMNILLTNTRVPRSTKVLVAGVKELYNKFPSIVRPIFDSIEGITARFLALGGANKDASEVHEEIGTIMEINHGLLNALGVGHPALEQVHKVSAKHGKRCKLTGAGGGGCAITLLEANAQAPSALDEDIRKLGFDTFRSRVGGEGVRWYPGATVD